jgi:hypothetical protein
MAERFLKALPWRQCASVRVNNANIGARKTAQWVKSIVCSSRGPEFNSQHPYGGSQPSVMGCLLQVCLKTAIVYSLHKINKSLKKSVYELRVLHMELLISSYSLVLTSVNILSNALKMHICQACQTRDPSA